jgi:hypothetical protein
MLTSTTFPRGISYSPSLPQFLTTKTLASVSRYPYLGRPFSGRRTMSTPLQSHEEPLPIGTRLKGDSGQIYMIEEILADRRKPLLCVYRARYGFSITLCHQC